MSEKEYEFGSEELTKLLWENFNSHIIVFNEVLKLLDTESSLAQKVILPMLHHYFNALKSMSLFVARGNLQNTYIMARVAVETGINIAYILADEAAPQKAIDHSNQKSFRDVFRKMPFDKSAIPIDINDIDISNIPKLENALNDYTGSKGQEIRQWTTDSISQRIDKIEEKFGQGKTKGTKITVFTIYRHGSEIIHGTYFGSIFHLGRTQIVPQKGKEWFNENYFGHFNMVLTIFGSSLDELIVILSDGQDELTNLVNQSNEITKQYRELVKTSY